MADQNKYQIANSVDPDETAHYEPSHLDLHCLLFGIKILNDIPICNNGIVQIQRWISPFQKLRGESINILFQLRQDGKKT